MTRLRAYLRFIDRFGGIAILLGFWGIFLVAFAQHMAPRLGYLAGKPIGLDAPCNRPECDFSVFWPAGKLAQAHDFATLYSPPRFIDVAGQMLIPHFPYQTFFYMPPTLLVLAPLSHFPFEIAALSWIGFCIIASLLLLRLAGYGWAVIAIGLLSPAALIDYQLVQFGMLGGALMLAAIRLGQRYPVLGGALSGLFAIKPQLGLILPVLWLGQRRWRAFAACGAVGLGLCLLSYLCFGQGAWRAYLVQGRAQSVALLGAPFDAAGEQGWGASVYWMLRSFGVGTGLTGGLQIVATLAAFAAMLLVKWRPAQLCAAAVCLNLIAVPFEYTCYMTAYGVILAQSAQSRHWRIGILDALLFLWPGLCLVISIATGHELTPLVVLAALWRTALPRPAPVLPAPAQE